MRDNHRLHLQLERHYRCGRDTTLKGAIITGNTVIADVGRNLTLESQQDSVDYQTNKPVPVNKKSTALNNSVNDQTAINTGTSGFGINVSGNTHLIGAVSLAAQQQGLNQLTTSTLITEDLNNQVTANVGGNLNLESLQDTSVYNAQQKSMGFSISAPIGAGAAGGSINTSKSNTNSHYASVNEQAGIFAGDGGFQVNVAGNTDLKGAVIASTDQAAHSLDKSGMPLNSLTTQTLTISNIENQDDYKASSMSMSAGVGTHIGDKGEIKSTPTASAGYASDSDTGHSVTVSGISGGTVNVTNQDNLITLASLNRDGNNLAGTLTPIFNQEQVQRELAAEVQITQAFSQVAPKTVGDYATK